MRPYSLRLPLLALGLISACATSPPAPERQAAAPRSSETAAKPAPAQAAPTATAPAAAQPPVTAAVLPPDVLSGAAADRVAELAKKAAPLVDAFANSEAVFTRDAKQVLIVSNRDGLPQLYVADATRPDSPARRLFASKERVKLDAPTPDGKALLFSTDRGADEKWSIWRVNLDGSGAVELTPGESMQRDGASVPDLAPDTMYYSVRRISEASSAVYAAPAIKPGPEREVYRDPKPGFLTDVSRDGKRGLFVRYPSRSENYLLLLDLASGAPRTLYPASGKVTIFSAKFSPDGRTIYVATDGGGEQAWLLALDAESGKEKARYVEKHPTTASILGIAVAKRGDALALSLDAGNRTEIRLLEARTLKPRAKVTMPLGQGFISDISEDGKRLIAIWSTPSSPPDAWAIDAKTGKVAALRKEPRPSLKEVPEMETSITEIRARDGLMLPTNVFLPKNRSGKLPVIVSYHGGPSANSRIRWSPLSAFFIGQGYAWVEPNVRGSGGFGRAFEEADNGRGRLAAFEDNEVTGRWAASQPWADPSRVIIFGGSYGGYTVLVGLTRMPTLWRAGVNLFGVANLKTFMATTTGLIREIFLVEFGDPDKDGPFLDSISPLKDVDKIAAPLFVYAGANDPRVPRSESDLIVRALRERKVPVEYMVADNEGHSLARKENLVEFMARSGRFLEQHVGKAAPSRAALKRAPGGSCQTGVVNTRAAVLLGRVPNC
jgi:dipeptidyl aminopeptidase/acylaminoacyl peptidase